MRENPFLYTHRANVEARAQFRPQIFQGLRYSADTQTKRHGFIFTLFVLYFHLFYSYFYILQNKRITFVNRNNFFLLFSVLLSLHATFCGYL